MEEILEFIHSRFPTDCHWLDGNCYYFSQFLLIRFPKGSVWYDVINGRFVFKYEENYYDWIDIVKPDGYLVEWEHFDEYESMQKQVIIRDCIL